MKLYKSKLIINLVNRLREWNWFNKYIWGKSKDMEDFLRNPAEELLDGPLAIENIEGTVDFCYRFFFKEYTGPRSTLKYYRDLEKYYYPNKIPEAAKLTHRKIQSKKAPRIRIGKWVLFDRTYDDKFDTKYPNALLMFNVIWCKNSFFKSAPGFNFVFRYRKTKYFQMGFGYCPRYWIAGNKFRIGSPYFKLRIGDYDSELKWNPGTEVYGYYEGAC